MSAPYWAGGRAEQCKPTEFVVIVEIDNKRALAAFQKGLDDLDALWPAIEASCKSHDDAVEEVERKKQEFFDENLPRFRELQKQYIKANEDHLARWKKWDEGGVFCGAEPKAPRKPKELIELQAVLFPPYPVTYPKMIEDFRQRREDLKVLRNLASAATAPYKVKEEVALAMIGWESGEKIDAIKQTIGSP